MRKLPPVFPLAALALVSISVFARATASPAPPVLQAAAQDAAQDAAGTASQSASPAPAQPSSPAPAHPQWSGSGMPAAQAYRAANRPRYVHYYSLEHRTPAQIDAADRELLRARSQAIANAALIYGYDLSQGNWIWDQSVCPAFPGTVMLHYLNKYPDGTQSLFTALVPRGKGRVRVVAALHRNAADYLPAVKDPRHYALFNELVPAAIAKQDASPEGKWLPLGVCYAEMVGGRPNVPDDPSLDVAMIRAPVSTFRVDSVEKTRTIEFPDREAANVYKIWTITLNPNGRLTGAANEDYATFVARAVKEPVPVGKITPNPPEPAARIVTPTSQPQVKVTNPPEIPHP